MSLVQSVRNNALSRRDALAMLAAAVAAGSAGAAESAILQPVSLDHVNLRVMDVAKSAAFYMGLFDTPVLRNPGLRARPGSPPSEGFFLKFGDGYLAISQAFAPELPGLDHYSIGLRNYDQAKMVAALKSGGLAAEARSVDIWADDPDGAFIQLRPPGGWARQTAAPYQGYVRTGPALSPVTMSRIALSTANLSRAGEYYARLFGTEIAAQASAGSRVFSIGGPTLELVSVANAAAHPGMDHMRIAIAGFSAEETNRVLRARGIESEAGGATIRVKDPDGIRIELAAA